MSFDTWKPIEASIVLPNNRLRTFFFMKTSSFWTNIHQSNPAYRDAILDHMNTMADISDAMNEHPSDGFTSTHFIYYKPDTARPRQSEKFSGTAS